MAKVMELYRLKLIFTLHIGCRLSFLGVECKFVCLYHTGAVVNTPYGGRPYLACSILRGSLGKKDRFIFLEIS